MAVGFPTKVNYATGDVLSAQNMNDLSGTVNLLQPMYENQYAAAKNKILNGDFSIWQRGTTFNSASSNTYFADRFTCYVGGGTQNITRQTFTPGTAPVAGYEGQYYLRWTSTSAGPISLIQRIENVQTFAGQTMTFSFWAKAAVATSISTVATQVFGSGGSTAVSQTSGSQAITTSWARYYFTFNVASVAGKTIGTSSYFQLDINLPNSTFTFDTWGWQAEVGSTVSNFQTATGNPASELAACQRYYWRQSAGTNQYVAPFCGSTSGTTNPQFSLMNPVPLRVKASSVDFSTLQAVDIASGYALSAITVSANSTELVSNITTTATGLTAYRSLAINSSGASGYLGFSAEL